MKNFLILVVGIIFALQFFVCPKTIFAGEVSRLEALTNLVQFYANEIFVNDFENVKNRTAGSVGEQNMAQNLQTQLENLELEKLDNSETFLQEFTFSKNLTSQNVVGLIDNGSTNFIVLGAHYDAVYVAENSYGYSDNISGVSAVLCLANFLKETPDLPYNIIVCFYGAEEVGCLGSTYFANNLPDEIKNNILLSINFDSVGAGDNLYYFHTDYGTKYGGAIDTFARQNYSNINKSKNTNFFSSIASNGINYSNLALNSDNSSFIKQGINSLSFFAGNLDAKNGLGFFETTNHERIMHSTDSVETIEEIFGEKFFLNIATIANFSFDLLTDESFTAENFEANQVQTFLYSDWFLKMIGASLVILLFVGFYVFVNIKYKK